MVIQESRGRPILTGYAGHQPGVAQVSVRCGRCRGAAARRGHKASLVAVAERRRDGWVWVPLARSCGSETRARGRGFDGRVWRFLGTTRTRLREHYEPSCGGVLPTWAATTQRCERGHDVDLGGDGFRALLDQAVVQRKRDVHL